MDKKHGLDYCVAFDTKEMPGKIVATRVRLDTVILGPDDAARIDLADHPLYPRLVSYVLANQIRQRKTEH
jgi:hypothetical protein